MKTISINNKKIYLESNSVVSKVPPNQEENTIILSHLSLKRKEYVIERFEYIFHDFDKKLKDFRNVNYQFRHQLC